MSGRARGQGRAAALRFAAEGAIDVGGDLRHESALVPQRLVRSGAVGTQPHEDYGFTMRAELDPVWPAAHIAWPYLVGSRGCIVTVGSTAGLTGSLTNQRTAFPQLSASLAPGGAPVASKGAVIAMARQLADDGAPYGIRANCVSPGVFDSEATRGDLPADEHPKRINARHLPLGHIGLPRRSSTRPSSSPRTRRRTSPAPTSSSTAAGCPYSPAEKRPLP